MFSVPFSQDSAFHKSLVNLEKRQEFENSIVQELKSITKRTIDQSAVLIDIPESISFEIDLFIYDQDTGKSSLFKNTDSIFSDKVISGFSQSLRNISLVCNREPEILAGLKKLNPRRLLEEGLC